MEVQICKPRDDYGARVAVNQQEFNDAREDRRQPDRTPAESAKAWLGITPA